MRRKNPRKANDIPSQLFHFPESRHRLPRGGEDVPRLAEKWTFDGMTWQWWWLHGVVGEISEEILLLL